VLVAATHGRGVYEILLPPVGAAVVGIDSPPLLPGPFTGDNNRTLSERVTFSGHDYTATVDSGHNILVSVDDGPGVPVREQAGGVAAPSLAVFNGQLYLAWTGTDQHVKVGKVILRPDGLPTGIAGDPSTPYTSPTTPTLVSFDNALIMCFTDNTDRIFLDFIN